MSGRVDLQETHEFLGVGKPFDIEHRIHEGVLLVLGERGPSQFAKLLDDIFRRGKRMLAPARGLTRFSVNGTIGQVDIDPHHMAEPCATRRDRRFFHDRYLAGQRDAVMIVHGPLGELVDEDVAFNEQGRDALGQVELAEVSPSGL
jgi:hypothetical protein